MRRQEEKAREGDDLRSKVLHDNIKHQHRGEKLLTWRLQTPSRRDNPEAASHNTLHWLPRNQQGRQEGRAHSPKDDSWNDNDTQSRVLDDVNTRAKIY